MESTQPSNPPSDAAAVKATYSIPSAAKTNHAAPPAAKPAQPAVAPDAHAGSAAPVSVPNAPSLVARAPTPTMTSSTIIIATTNAAAQPTMPTPVAPKQEPAPAAATPVIPVAKPPPVAQRTVLAEELQKQQQAPTLASQNPAPTVSAEVMAARHEQARRVALAAPVKKPAPKPSMTMTAATAILKQPPPPPTRPLKKTPPIPMSKTSLPPSAKPLVRKQPNRPKTYRKKGPKGDDEYDAANDDGTATSTLGFLTRKFCNLVQASITGAVDLNEAAIQLQVPKRRIYDITNVLEGVGLIDKKSKNLITWKGGSGAASKRKGSGRFTGGGPMEAALLLKKDTTRLRSSIDHLYQEEAMLDAWIAKLTTKRDRLYSSNAVNGSEIDAASSSERFSPDATNDGGHGNHLYVNNHQIIQALYYPEQTTAPTPFALARSDSYDRDQRLEDGKPKAAPLSSIVAVHAPIHSVVEVTARTSYRLAISTQTDLQKHLQEAKSHKRKNVGPNAYHEAKRSHSNDNRRDLMSVEGERRKIQLYLLPTAFDKDHEKKMVSSGVKVIGGRAQQNAQQNESVVEEIAGEIPPWSCAMPTLAAEEGVSDFFPSIVTPPRTMEEFPTTDAGNEGSRPAATMPPTVDAMNVDQ